MERADRADWLIGICLENQSLCSQLLVYANIDIPDVAAVLSKTMLDMIGHSNNI